MQAQQVKLLIDNSTCQLIGLSSQLHKKLANEMSYYVQASQHYFSGNYGSRKRTLLSKRDNFPTGLLYIFEEFAEKEKLQYEKFDKRIVPEDRLGLLTVFNGLPYTPHKDQEEAVDAAIEHSRGIIVAPTGVGKSAIAVLLCLRFDVKALIIVPTLELKRQLTETMSLAFGIDNVGPLDGLGQCVMPITIENVDALSVNQAYEVDLVIIDEFHRSGAKTYRELNKKSLAGVYYKIGLTATPFRSKEDERLLLESVLSKVIYSINYLDAVRKNYIVPMEVQYIQLEKKPFTGVKWAQIYSELVVNNQNRNKIIANLLESLHKAGKVTLCLVEVIEHAHNILDECQTKFNFIYGNIKDREAISRLGTTPSDTILIGTSGVLGEGVDTKAAEYIIIAGSGKSKNAFMQKVGRGFRRYPGKSSCKVVLFKDDSHVWLERHFAAVMKYLKTEYNNVPTRIL